jgi:hypothetical protein
MAAIDAGVERVLFTSSDITVDADSMMWKIPPTR